MSDYRQEFSEYVTRTFAAEDAALERIRELISQRGLPEIMIRREEAAFLRFLVAATGAKRAVEIGTLGGYSGVWIARALPEEGKLITLELDEKHAQVARESFELAGVSDKVDLRLGDALELLPKLAEAGPFDLVFIDANKDGYPQYLDWALENIEIGGVVAAHNALTFGGKAILQEPTDELVETMKRFNLRLAQDPRLVATIYPAGAGMALAVRTS